MSADGIEKTVMEALRNGIRLASTVNLDGDARGVNNDPAVGTPAHVCLQLLPQGAIEFVV